MPNGICLLRLGQIWGLRLGISGLRAPNPARGVCGHTPGPRRQGVAPGPHWCAARPRPPACRIASLSLALLAQGLLASLLLNFNSAALHGNSDGVSNQELSAWGWVQNSDFFEKIGLLGRS
jgi:hypothetical protein